MPDELSVPALSVFVPGQPAPQGSKRHIGRGIMIESSKAVPLWRNDVRAALINRFGRPQVYFDGAVAVDIAFVLYRPKSTPKRRTPQAVKIPDLDKLIRAVLDAITSAGVWRDDAQVVQLFASKRLARPNEAMGCHLRIAHAAEDAPA